MIKADEFYRRQTLSVDDTNLALHCWVPPQASAMVFYFHGIQSHAGWLCETGPFLAKRGVALYALDRRGAGLSEGKRGHISAYSIWINDYLEGYRFAKIQHPGLPTTLLGQSFGGSLMAALISRHAIDHEARIFCAPGLHQASRFSPSEAEKFQLLKEKIQRDPSSGEAYFEIKYPDEAYTSDENYIHFLKNDPLMSRQVTAQNRLETLAMEAEYMHLTQPWTNKPTMFVYPRFDRIMNTELALQAMRLLTEGNFLSVEFPVGDHYLEFSVSRGAYLNLVAAFAQTSGFSV